MREAKIAEPEKFELKKGSSGRNLCRFCNQEVSPPRRTFCSAECVHEWNVRSNTRYARACVRKRDKSICQICQLDCGKLRQELNRMDRVGRNERAKELGIPKHRVARKSLWDLDHIIPVVEGGGCCGLDNLRTLCWKCHLEKTKEEAKKRNHGRT